MLFSSCLPTAKDETIVIDSHKEAGAEKERKIQSVQAPMWHWEELPEKMLGVAEELNVIASIKLTICPP